LGLANREFRKENTMATNQQKETFAPFLKAIASTNSVKGQFAQAYYEGGIAQLVGTIERFVPQGPARIRVFLTMLATLPSPEWTTLHWLMTSHPFFNGNVTPTSDAIFWHWLEPSNSNASIASWVYTDGEDPRDYEGAWANKIYGRFVKCERHGWQFCTSRDTHSRRTTYRDGSYDCSFEETLACGCHYACIHYAGDSEPQRTRRI
jgi:hypothetical protein